MNFYWWGVVRVLLLGLQMTHALGTQDSTSKKTTTLIFHVVLLKMG